MDMSSAASSSTSSSDMDGWKPYLHTSLFSPFSNQPDAGEAFLFPTFRIYSRATFLAACAFTFSLALVERYLTYLLDTTLSLQQLSSSHTSLSGRTKRKNSLMDTTSSPHSTARESASVYVHLPSVPTPPILQETRRTKTGVKIAARNAVYFGATLLRYVLMIIGMSMDWFMLLSLVSGLTLGHLLTDLYAVACTTPWQSAGDGWRRGEEVELLHRDAEEFDIADEEDANKEAENYITAGADMRTHRRANSRQASIAVTTPY